MMEYVALAVLAGFVALWISKHRKKPPTGGSGGGRGGKTNPSKKRS